MYVCDINKRIEDSTFVYNLVLKNRNVRGYHVFDIDFSSFDNFYYMLEKCKADNIKYLAIVSDEATVLEEHNYKYIRYLSDVSGILSFERTVFMYLQALEGDEQVEEIRWQLYYHAMITGNVDLAESTYVVIKDKDRVLKVIINVIKGISERLENNVRCTDTLKVLNGYIINQHFTKEYLDVIYNYIKLICMNNLNNSKVFNELYDNFYLGNRNRKSKVLEKDKDEFKEIRYIIKKGGSMY